MSKIKGRAHTPEEKRIIIEKLYEVWIKDPNHYLRLGQLLFNAAYIKQVNMFNIEDQDLIDILQNTNNE